MEFSDGASRFINLCGHSKLKHYYVKVHIILNKCLARVVLSPLYLVEKNFRL